MLFGERDRDPVRVYEAHRCLHDADAFDVDLFERWLAHFDATLDEGWRGPAVEHARHRAHGFAWAMSRRLADIDVGPRPGASA